jgi:plastocyanin
LAPVQSGAVTVLAGDNVFEPQTLTVADGTEITFTNDGRNQHNVLAVGDTPFSAETASFEPGESFTWKASKPGTYRYYCSIHGTATAGMTGTIQVVAP